MYGGRFEPRRELELLEEVGPQVFCAPPTEYRLLVKEEKLASLSVPRLRECVSAGEPLNPEVIRAWHEHTRPHDPRRLRADGVDPADRELSRATRCARARWASRCPATSSP